MITEVSTLGAIASLAGGFAGGYYGSKWVMGSRKKKGKKRKRLKA